MEQEFTEFSEFRESDKSLKHELVQGYTLMHTTLIVGQHYRIDTAQYSTGYKYTPYGNRKVPSP